MTLLVRVAPHNEGLVIAREERARWVGQINEAIEASTTWGEFQRQMPENEYSRIVREKFEENGEASPSPEDEFNPEAIPGWADGDYPPWLQAEMDQVIPRRLLLRYGSLQNTALNGSYWHIPESSLEDISSALQTEGWTVLRADDVEFR